jgi:outer membrane protein OmpA-like peptidoglycan-associated protein
MADHAKQQKVEQPSRQEMKPSQEAQLEPQTSPEIYTHASNVVNLQRYLGNSGVQRMLKNGSIQTMPQHRLLTKAQPGIQREGPDGGTTDAATTASPDAAPAADPRLDGILNNHFISHGERFDVDYEPNNGRPAATRPISGKTTITLKLHITFRNFTREIRSEAPYNTMRFTPEQRRDFNWTPEEQEEFRTNIVPSIQDGWKEKHLLECRDTGLEELNTILDVVVQLVGTSEEAHNKVTAQKIPTGAPRFRSFVQGDTSVLDRLDPTEAETNDVDERVWHIQPFDDNSADVAPVQGQLDDFVREFDALPPTGTPADEQAFSEQYVLRMVGRATSPGTRQHNRGLGQRRADAVDEYIFNHTSRTSFTTRSTSEGETGTTTDVNFRGVDVYLTRRDGATQNVAAHEAGHMFGLGDEYEDTEATDDAGRGRFTGDAPRHDADVQQALGPDAPPNLEVRNSESMMAVGSNVGPEHYTPFILQLESLTGLDWTIR